ncbi:HigB toxin protein [Nitratiruptor sp. YY08-26]|uniref:type II toxin-antitoxin system RelE/ParE family toxin n=1 Tax=unclassified Nitratiruptor TaxID=2624044 RepID=UPI001915B213|nr:MULTISPECIES: type II toxin-antitoxin system mRNA interferase toxin, RelE/StbE family [unclassified Nitratiruptor]BCD61464.1 HigB toxin protein [Nitratiruptor sp. YY08-13]BCD65398.1 HigB toxin protein [Nitratiruptor sp. YY08-26]
MKYKILQSEKYLKRAAKFFKKHPNLLPKYKKVIEQLENDPYYPSLRLHKLKGDLNEYYSVSIDMHYRIVIDLIITDKEIILLDIGSHDEVY